MPGATIHHPGLPAVLCGTLATGLGLICLHNSGAPPRYLAVNATAWTLGVIIVGTIEFAARRPSIPRDTACLIASLILLLVSLFGTSVDGAKRWVSLYGVSLQPAFFVVPVTAIYFARHRTAVMLGSLFVVSLSIALQPDRSMAASLAAGTGALLLLRGGRLVAISFAGAVACFAATWFRADTLPAQPFVEGVVAASLQTSPLAAATSICGLALLVVPAIAGWVWRKEQRDTYLVFASAWIALVAASILGNYPTPFVGYSSSAILGYAISILGLPPTRAVADRS